MFLSPINFIASSQESTINREQDVHHIPRDSFGSSSFSRLRNRIMRTQLLEAANDAVFLIHGIKIGSRYNSKSLIISYENLDYYALLEPYNYPIKISIGQWSEPNI